MLSFYSSDLIMKKHDEHFHEDHHNHEEAKEGGENQFESSLSQEGDIPAVQNELNE